MQILFRNENASEEKGNLLVYLDYRKEDRSCPDGQVLDIYGYCRLITNFFHKTMFKFCFLSFKI